MLQSTYSHTSSHQSSSLDAQKSPVQNRGDVVKIQLSALLIGVENAEIIGRWNSSPFEVGLDSISFLPEICQYNAGLYTAHCRHSPHSPH